MPVVAERFAGGTEQGQQHDGEGVDQPLAVAPVGGADVRRAHTHAEAQVLGVAERALDASMGTQLAKRGARLQTIMNVLGHESAAMAMVYARVSDPEILRDYRSVLEPGAVIAGAGAEAVHSGALDRTAVHGRNTNCLKTELELGHCLRLPFEGPCECDLYLNCSRFVTPPAYVLRLRERHQLELTLAEDARARSWSREVQRHCAVGGRIEWLLADLGEAPF